MPLYMDRHDVSPVVTAENVAELHQKDLKIQHLYNCRGLTYWFDAKRGTAFCLVDAPNMKSLQEMHSKAHGEVPNQIIEVEASIVESFLGRIEDPVKSQNAELNIINDPAFRTIMVIKTPPNSSGESSFFLTAEKLKNSICKLIKNSEGSIVKQTNCYFLISFKSVSKAINCAKEIRFTFEDFAKESAIKNTLNLGLSAGVPVTKNQSFFEGAIKLAERLCDVAHNKIMISTEVKELYNSENANGFSTSGDIFYNFLPGDEKLFSELMNFMESCYSDAHLTVHNFTRSLALSKSTLYRKILQLTGKSLNPFIRDYRLNKAMELLQNKTYTFSEIAYKTGFTSLSYFSKCFQKKYGKVPSALIQE